MLSRALAKGFSDQANMEFHSAYTYLEFANRMDKFKMPGMAHWMRVQAVEELSHASRFLSFLQQWGADIELGRIDAPKVAAKNVTAIFALTFKQEQAVTASIKALAELAVAEKDFAALSFLQTFLIEQLEEERSVQQIIDRVEICGRGGEPMLLFVDAELGKRPCPCGTLCFCGGGTVAPAASGAAT